MPLSSLPDLMRALAASRLLTAADLAELQGAPPLGRNRTVGEVLQHLIQQKRLTRWQAGRLMEGQTGFHFDKYLLLDQLGAGGMGTVFRARQSGMDRIVALKVMSRKLIKDANSLARFQREVETAAALQHPNIVLALDADSRQGVPYLVMEYIAGEDLRSVLTKQGRLPVGQACEYARQAALGLQHAHERGMVHRDIKPANLLLTRTADGRPLVKILDFGLARFQSESRDSGEITRTGEIMGTPDYISPEQATDTRSADIRSDIYSLGCTLYHWLSGSVPFPGNSLMERLMARGMRDPVPLSSQYADVPAGLSAIVQKMLARDPARRYQTPAEVAKALAPYCVTAATSVNVATPRSAPSQATQELPKQSGEEGELQQFLAVMETEATLPGGTVETQGVLPTAVAKEPKGSSSSSRLQRNITRHAKAERKQWLFTAAMVTVAGLLVAGVAVWQSGNHSTLVLDWPLDERAGATLAVDGRELRIPGSAQIVLSGPIGRRTVRLTRDGYEPFEFEKDLRRGGRESVPVAWTPNLATRRADLWHMLADRWPNASAASDDVAQTRADVIQFQRQFRGTREAVAAAEKARGLPWPVDALSAVDAQADRMQPHVVGVLGDARWKYARQGVVRGVTFDPSGRHVIASGADRRMSFWNVATGLRTQRIELDNYPLGSVCPLPVGDRFLVSDEAGLIALVSRSAGEAVWTTKWAHGLGGFVAATPTGDKVVAASFDGSIKRLDPATGKPLSSITPGKGVLLTLAMSRDGRWFAANRDKHLWLWEEADATEPRDLGVVGDYATSLAFTADGRWLVCPILGKSLTVWDTATWTPRDLPDTDQIVCIAVDPTRPRVVAASQAGSDHTLVRMFDLDDFGTVRHTLRLPPVRVWSMAISPDGQRLAYGDEYGGLGLWDLVAEREVEPPARRMMGFAVLPDGSAVVTGDDRDEAAAWQLSDGRVRDRWETGQGGLSSVAVSHDGRVVATAVGSPPQALQPRIQLWDAGDHRLLGESPLLPMYAMSLAFSPDDTLLAASLFDGTTRLYDVATGRERQSLPGCPDNRMDAFSVVFSPDGRTLATGYWIWEKPVRLWDLTTNPASEKRWFTGPTHNVRSVAFSPLGDLLVAGCDDEVVRLWNPVTGKQDDYLPNHTGGALAVATSPDGQWLAVGDGSGHVSLWPLVGKRIVPTHHLRVGPYDEPVLQVQFTLDSRHVLAMVDNGTVAIVRLAERSAEK